MIEKELTITLEHGIHARPAAELVKLLNRYKSHVLLYDKGKEYNPKSILSMMSAAIRKGQTVRIIIDGEDEEETWEFLKNHL